MLVIFLTGPTREDQTLDLVDVVPRDREKVIRKHGLGKKETRYFWVEVDDSHLSDEEFTALALELTSPIEEIIRPKSNAGFKLKLPKPKRRLISKSRYRLKENELEKLDSTFSASTALRSKRAKKNYPQRKITLEQFKKIIMDKTNGS